MSAEELFMRINAMPMREPGNKFKSWNGSS